MVDSKERSLHHLATYGPTKLLRERIAAGADVHARDDCGATLLHRAALASDVELAEWLLAETAIDPAAVDDNGKLAAEYVFLGNVSCDPEDVNEWRTLRETLLAAARGSSTS